MAFSLRKIISNINYFKKPEEQEFEEVVKKRRHTYVSNDVRSIINFEEPDSTSRQSSLIFPESVKNFAAKKVSLSDTDLLLSGRTKTQRRKCKKLKLDIDKASRSMTEPIQSSKEDFNVENTPKHILLECHTSDIFSERIKGFDFSKSFEINDAMADDMPSSPFEEENYDIQSLSDQSDSEGSEDCSKPIMMCRKVEPIDTNSSNEDHITAPSATPESFGDFEIDKNEEERMKFLTGYQNKFEKVQYVLRRILSDFRFHIEYSKVFNTRSIIPAPSASNIPKSLEDVTHLDDISRGPSPDGSWNIVHEKEDKESKMKVKNQLQAIKHTIDLFVEEHLQNCSTDTNTTSRKYLSRESRSITFDIHKGQRQHKRINVTPRKKMKYFDFPDLREAMINLFSLEAIDDTSVSGNNITILLSDSEDSDSTKCNCNCHCQHSPSETEETTNKTDASLSSITSSIGNFTLDSSTLTAYSETLDQIVSYNSFEDTSLYGVLLQKATIERITFYVQVHSIQLKCEQHEQEFESRNVITFHCPSCKTFETEENGLMKHILSQTHCEKIHFLYKTAYIKRCVSTGKEIQPSTVLNSMKMYRDDNKIVCFGDSLYACSLCFENLIIGESILMAHCAEPEHIDRRQKLNDIIE